MMKRIILAGILMGFTIVSCNKKADATDTTMLTDSLAMENDILVDSEHNAQNSLDWSGTYEGTLPCADCEGIKTTIVLNQDGTFSSKEHYLKEPAVEVESTGNFTWDETGFIVTLESDNFKRSYRVVERAIIHLDNNANEITGELAEHYRLAQK